MTTIRLSPSGKEVEAKTGETVLETLENAGYALPNNCRAGACGECKVKVLEGEFDQGMVLDMALSQEERAEGYGLMCMCKPLGEVLEIDWGTDDAKPKLFPPRENVRCMVVDRIERTDRIAEIRLRPIGEPLRFWPGQYVSLTDTQKTVTPRSYSIANAPRPDGEIVLQITRVPEGKTSNWVHQDVRPGSMVNLSGPYGTFIGDPSTDGPVLCLAAGTGLAPILSLTDAALRRGFKQPVHLMFSARTEADIYCRGLLELWNTRHRRFKFIPTLTREEKEGTLHGRIPELIAGQYPDLSKHAIYIAGSPEFVEDCIAAVKAQGAQADMIHTEGFFDQAQPETPSSDRLVG
ncbi:2Fe-2S iron-sulfur cluster-binding protein [Marinobacterium sediminicola]|uniref:CDP-4-dehydro-6-deoxyglucose reductase n=1 Tax=Marinobacterium sediminicola TaxID=518898 RepID=A0ABY1S415_9GAMM|nr:2Fe-2S iron-sulfur cluster-binding protein [Marinobacterium sediminicola]ULG70122.1 2Fe-2S iron-sulfur cluster-binding protein [Marinobacterium sediminicola]SMR78397.1 CDP-4-dehydro-6-deoxyglucose reductase [Marinobacterium sediminicola]